jgi:hypothetical protein
MRVVRNDFDPLYDELRLIGFVCPPTVMNCAEKEIAILFGKSNPRD